MNEFKVDNKEDIYNKLVEILVEMFEIPEEKITPTTNLTDLDIDSIDAVDLVVRLSKLTGKKMNPETFKAIRTVDDIVQALDIMVLGDKK